MILRFYLCLALFSFSVALSADTTLVRYPGPEESIDPRKSYFVDLLKLSLDKSADKFGPYRMQQTSIPMYQDRQLKSLESGLIDVVWTVTSNERESIAKPVYIPLMKGLLGYRVFIINEKDKQKFLDINSTEELKALLAYQGHDWPDTTILKSQGFRVETSSWYMGLFKLLSHGRYHYFPRGILEAWEEVDSMGYDNLIVDEKHLIIYPSAIYFFVNKSNDKLAERLTFGLQEALSDGSFDQLLFHHPFHEKTFERANLSKRKIHQLENPLLPITTPLDNKTLWYKMPSD